MDRLEDDDQRSPERRPPKTAVTSGGGGLNYDQHPLSRSPTGGDGGFVMPMSGSPDRRETFGQVRPGSGGYQINMIGDGR